MRLQRLAQDRLSVTGESVVKFPREYGVAGLYVKSIRRSTVISDVNKNELVSDMAGNYKNPFLFRGARSNVNRVSN